MASLILRPSAKNGACKWAARLPCRVATALSLCSPNGLVLVAGEDGSAAVFTHTDGALVVHKSLHAGCIRGAVWVAESRVLTAATDRRILLSDASLNALREVALASEPVSLVACENADEAMLSLSPMAPSFGCAATRSRVCRSSRPTIADRARSRRSRARAGCASSAQR